MDAQFDILGKLLIELLEAVLVLDDLINELQALLDKVLPDDFENLVLLQHLTRDVKGQIFRINDSLDEVEVFWDEFFTVVHDEDSSNIKLDVVLLFLILKKVKRSSFGHEEQSPELKLSLYREVFDSQVFLPIVCQGLVELPVLLLRDVIRVSGPDGLCLVQLFILGVLLLQKNVNIILRLIYKQKKCQSIIYRRVNNELVAKFTFLYFKKSIFWITGNYAQN